MASAAKLGLEMRLPGAWLDEAIPITGMWVFQGKLVFGNAGLVRAVAGGALKRPKRGSLLVFLSLFVHSGMLN